MSVRILTGDCRERLAAMAPDSVDCVVTSPPYPKLRDYGVAGQIGAEASIAEYVAVLVDVFAQVRRVLKPDGSLWLNLGDKYAGSWGAQERRETPASGWRNSIASHPKRASHTGTIRDAGLKPKDLIGVPWRVAFALQADGWWVRNDHVWWKVNGMRESVRDRATRSHEVVFHLTKSAESYYGYDDVRLPPHPESVARLARARAGRGDQDGALVISGGGYAPPGQPPHAGARRSDKQRGHSRRHAGFNDRWDAMERDEKQAQGAALGTVWPLAPAQSFWMFCLACERFYKRGELDSIRVERPADGDPVKWCRCGRSDAWVDHYAVMPEAVAGLCIEAGCPPGGTVLDPFAGAGTTGLAADRLGRGAVLIELNPAYAACARARIGADAPLLTDVAASGGEQGMAQP